MNQTKDEERQIDLIDHTHPQEIMPNTMTKTRTTTKSKEREEIIRESQEEKQKREENEERDRCCSLIREKIGEEKLIQSENKRFGVELTLSTKMARGTKTKEIPRSTKISFQTTPIVQTKFAAIELIVVEKTFHSRVILGTETEIDIVSETETSGMSNAQLMVVNRRGN